MSDEPTDDTIRELRERVKRLESRVNELENTTGHGSDSTDASGHDHRDERVLEAIRDLNTEPSPRQTVKLYIRTTDISDESTAARRAKQLRRTPGYSKAVRE